MNRRVAVLVALVALLVGSAATAVAVTVADGHGYWSGYRDSMMSSRWDGPTSGQQPEWQGRDAPTSGWMMPGLMHGARVASEYDYLAEMLVHHQEAVAAAQQLQRSPRAEMRRFGQDIVASQSAQIDQMQGWLAEWYPNRSGQVNYQPMMRDLTGLSGDQLDRAFLQDMIWHHMAAVMMSQRLLARGVTEHDEVEALAEDIRDEQHAEIFQMQQWLREWFGAGGQNGMRGGCTGMGGMMSGPWMMP